MRRRQSLYRVGRGEQGVLLVEPYKSEILPLWRFKTPREAEASSRLIMRAFRGYLKKGDFVGMDMTRKFLQMGFTRARRYANHKSGQKYLGPVPKKMKGRSGAHDRRVAPVHLDHEKAKSAAIFYKAWQTVEKNLTYKMKKQEWKQKYG